jgi:glycerol-3-phosphate acyltransferase PlsY
LLKPLGFGIIAYLLGSIPFALLVTRWKAGIDVRSIGSGHATATNTMRIAGWLPGILVMRLDVAKGYLAVWLALRFGDWSWTPALAASMVVIGHCWPIFARFRGGMGLGCGGGGLIAMWPFGFVLALGLGAALQLIIRHSARANVVTGLLLAPLWIAFGATPEQWVLAGVAGVIVAYRALSDWNRVYRELWWDRE